MLWKGKHKRKIGIAVLAVLVVILAAGVGIYQMTSGKDKEENVVTKETTAQTGNLTVGITESGNVSIDSLTQSFTLDWSGSSSSSTGTSSTAAGSQSGADKESGNASAQMSSQNTSSAAKSTTGSAGSSSSDAELVVEKVFVSTGQQVKEGDKLLKLTKESVAQVREVYQSNYEEAQEALQEAKLTRDSQKLTAEYDYKQAVAAGETAYTTYQATLASLEAAVSSAKSAYQEAKSGIATLPKEITALKKQIAAQAGAQEEKKSEIEQTDNSADSVNGNNTKDSSADSVNSNNTKDSSADSVNSNDTKDSSADSVSSNDTTDSTSAVTQLQQQLTQKQTQLSQYRANLSSLKSAYHAAVKAQTTGKIEAKSVYQQSKLSQKNAKTTYQATVSSLNADVKEARETYTQAQEAKEEFETFVKGRVVRAEYSGTLSALGYQEGDSLSSATDIATYLDADAVTITVSVSEEDVANIQVGNAVNIYLSAYEDELFEGEVQSISSTATGDSTVSYPVVVTVTSDVSKIYSGMTSEVTFVSKEVENVLYVSNKAITTEGTNSYVLLKKEDGTTQKTKVTTGFSDGHNVEIQSGLEEGDIVLIESKVSQ